MLLHQVKLPHFKHSAESETVKLPMPDKVVISMAQHLGAPCTTTVKVGDKVKIGDVIGAVRRLCPHPFTAVYRER